MKKAVFLRMVGITLAVLIVAAAIAAAIMNSSYRTELKQNIYYLLETTDTIADPAISKNDLAKKISAQSGGYRVTFIAPDGTVLGDSYANYADLENHLNRPEVQGALSSGKADSIRYSATQKTNVFYAALLLQDGNVMRIAVPLEGIHFNFSLYLPVILLSVVLLIGVVLFLAGRISGSVLRPLLQVSDAVKDIKEQGYSAAIEPPKYEELAPLVQEVNELAENIRYTTTNLQIEKQKLTFLLDSMRQGLIVVDRSLKIIHHNKSAAMLFEAQTQLTGKSLLNLTHINKIISTVEKCLEQGATAVFYMEFAQSERIYSISVNPIKGDWMEDGAIIIFTDVTEQRKAEQMRREFFDNASHELKTPITSIKGFAELLLNNMIPPEQQKDALARIGQEAENMTKLIEDILSLSRLEENRLVPTIDSVNILQAANEVISALEPQSSERHIEVSASGEDVLVSADRQDIYRLLSNLVENAVKYNKENGSVKVQIQKEGNKCRITVTDTGIGIPPKDIPRIFERFYRVDKGRSRSVGGTGLGLSIVKHIVAAYGGEINVKSVLGEGTTMEIYLKAEK